MHVVVLGAGAVGCYFGGLLAMAGHRVTLIGRASHVDAIRARGLLLEMGGVTETVTVEAATSAEGVDTPDLVLVCVKSADSADAGRQIAPRLGPLTILLSLQNGVDNAERIAATAGRAVVPAVVYVGTGMAGPGHVRHHGRGDLLIGPSPASAEIARTLTEARIPTTVSDNIAGALWQKLIVNCAYNALSAVGRIPYGAMVEVEGAREVMSEVVSECVQVATALGVVLPGDITARTLAVAAAMPQQFSSTAQDLMRGKPTEVDFLNGYVVRKGRELGIATPTNRALQVMVKLAEAGGAAKP
jgi:2-dehydropantoate 2-reductase